MRTPSPISRLISLVLSAFFHALYNPLAWTYDGVAAIVSVGRWKDWVLSVLGDVLGPRVLELGHGPGHLQCALVQKRFITFGIDQSRKMGLIARRRMQLSNHQYHLVNGKGQNLPFADKSFDQVVATFPTPYLFQKQTLEEIYRVLTPVGALIVLPEAWITGTSLLDRFAASLFQISGQTCVWGERYVAPFVEAGFVTSIDHRKLESSTVVIILALKHPDHS